MTTNDDDMKVGNKIESSESVYVIVVVYAYTESRSNILNVEKHQKSKDERKKQCIRL